MKKNQENNKGAEKEECLFPVCVTKRTRAESEAVACPGTRLLDPEPQRPYLAFLLMRNE